MQQQHIVPEDAGTINRAGVAAWSFQSIHPSRSWLDRLTMSASFDRLRTSGWFDKLTMSEMCGNFGKALNEDLSDSAWLQ